MNHPELMVMKDPRADVEFWLGALQQEDSLTRENIDLLNKCLTNALKGYLEPPEAIRPRANMPVSREN